MGPTEARALLDRLMPSDRCGATARPRPPPCRRGADAALSVMAPGALRQALGRSLRRGVEVPAILPADPRVFPLAAAMSSGSLLPPAERAALLGSAAATGGDAEAPSSSDSAKLRADVARELELAIDPAAALRVAKADNSASRRRRQR